MSQLSCRRGFRKTAYLSEKYAFFVSRSVSFHAPVRKFAQAGVQFVRSEYVTHSELIPAGYRDPEINERLRLKKGILNCRGKIV